MPIYEYTCSKCGHIFEEWTQCHDSPEAQSCPKCGNPAHRIISNTSFLLKGRGWYATEYGTLKGHTEDTSATQQTTSEHTSAPSEATNKATKAPEESKTA